MHVSMNRTGQNYTHPFLLYNFHNFYSLLLYALGVVYFYYLTSDEMSRKGYFDENALMTGMVRREFSNQRSIGKHAEDIKQLGDDRYVHMASYVHTYH